MKHQKFMYLYYYNYDIDADALNIYPNTVCITVASSKYIYLDNIHVLWLNR